MKHRLALCLLPILYAGLIAPPAAAAPVEPPADDAVFVEGSRYSAVLHPRRGAWRLLGPNGEDLQLRVRESCRAGLAPPRGLWLLTRDRAGRPQLLAPSSTPLPPGHPGEVLLVPCDQTLPADRPALAVPTALVEWLDRHSGAIYVTR
ncbi:hypothetical protein [Arenimonas fontis]|uniref:Uncharacterized protein n=1 Tax=Arenimonas fontis TaxID=2608255 RepID=A0A5B2ZAR8_9GAMM|nr:hypothetical protein [Arenimonas fontis]KAA2285045.1 hypothetical protein F0415_07325 [Arenimonas fontis]